MRSALVAAAIAGPASACGEDTDGAAREVVAGLQQAFAGKDLEAICAEMTPLAKRQAGLMAHGRLEACERDVGEALDLLGQGAWTEPGTSDAVAVDDNRATVTLTGDVDVALRRQDSAWRIDSFFGTPEPLAARYRRELPTLESPGPEEAAVAAFDGRGQPCPVVDTRDYFDITGGCTLEATSMDLRVDLETVFGTFEFGRCELRLEARIGPDGRTWMTRFKFGAATLNGCADIYTCRNPRFKTVSWPGRLESDGDGGYVLYTRACFDSCVGYYTGDLELRLEPSSAGGMRIVNAGRVGTSGLAFEGELDIESDIQLRAADE